MFERYTELARRAVFFARYEAAQVGGPQIETQHLLLGLLREDRALAERFLRSGESIAAIRGKIESRTSKRDKLSTSVALPLSHQSKRALAYGAEEADRLRCADIGTVHLLLGLLREEESLAASILRDLGLSLVTIRAELASFPHTPELASYLTAQPGSMAHPEAPWTPQARRAISVSRDEAVRLECTCLDTRHLLLAVLRDEGVAERLLGNRSAAEAIRQSIRPDPQPREMVSVTEMPLTLACQRALTYAIDERQQLKHHQIGVEHILLGLLREENCAAAGILREHGLTIEGLRATIAVPPSDPEQGRNYV